MVACIQLSAYVFVCVMVLAECRIRECGSSPTSTTKADSVRCNMQDRFLSTLKQCVVMKLSLSILRKWHIFYSSVAFCIRSCKEGNREESVIIYSFFKIFNGCTLHLNCAGYWIHPFTKGQNKGLITRMEASYQYRIAKWS